MLGGKNFFFMSSPQDLKQLLEAKDFDSIVSMWILRDGMGHSRGVGFVRY